MKLSPLMAVLLLLAPITLRAAQAPPHNISAANLNVIQNDSANTEASVTVTSPLVINDLRVRIGSNRGDYNIQIGETGVDDQAGGLIMTAVSQNGRYNLDERSEPIYGAPSFDAGANGYWVVVQDVTSDRAEYNVNAAVAYFRYSDWLSGWARNATAVNGGTNNLFTGSPGLILGTHFQGISAARSRVDLRTLGINSTNSGVLIVNHAKNEGNFALSVANPDGTWEIYVKDNFGNATNPRALEHDPAAFVFIPKTNTTVVSGKFGLDATGTNAITLMHSGATPSFTVKNLAEGRYRLTIPGFSPSSGVLITSCEGGFTNNFDNVVSYEADGDGWIIESRDTGVYPPALEACINEPVASFVFIPAAKPGFSVSPLNGLITSEYGVSASFSVVLDISPVADVTLQVGSSDPTEGTATPGSLTFTPANWNVPQQVSIKGMDDGLPDGPVAYRIVLGAAASADPAYSGIKPPDVSVLNADDEQAGIFVTPVSDLITSEDGGTSSFSILLSKQPSADVVIGLGSGSPGEGSVAPASITFTAADWTAPKVVTVTGVDDFRQDGSAAYQVVTSPAASADRDYNGVNPADVSVVNKDNDLAGYVWSYTLPLTVVEGATTNYTLRLGAQPTSNVVVNVTSGNTNAVKAAPASITFTPDDWSSPRTITLTAADNLTNNAPVNLNINHQPATGDPLYSQLASAISLPTVVIDNEANFALPSGETFYGLGMPAIGIDGQATILDVDAISYNGGGVTASIVTNASAADRLEIRSDSLLTVTGSDVKYQVAVIGRITEGPGGTRLAVVFNNNATVAAVQHLIRSITFQTQTASTSISTPVRTIEMTLNDGLGVVVTAAKQLRVGPLRLTQYQEGGDHGYGTFSGVADIALSQVGSDTPWPVGRTPAPQEGLLLDWPDGGTPNESQVLMRFDGFVGTNFWQVPSNAVVLSAELLLRVNNTGDGGKFHRMLIPWDSTNATWNSMVEGVSADDIEARSSYESQLGVEDGSGATGTGVISVGVTADVQAWVRGEANFGWVMKGWPLMTDGTGFSPSEVPAVEERPRLRVLWMLPGGSLATFRQGLKGYSGTMDTNLRQATNDVAYAAEEIIWSDANDTGGTNTMHGLLRFENIIGSSAGQIPAGARILAAFLDLASVGPDAMGDGGRLHAILKPWTDSTSTWISWGDGIHADGIEAAIVPTVVAGNSGLNPDVQGTVNTFEVTSDIQAWVAGIRPNYGWAILPWISGSNGWGFRSSEYVSLVRPEEPERDRPTLRVYYTNSSEAQPASLRTVTVTGSLVLIPFTGTPGQTYSVMRAGSVNGAWSKIGSATAAADGTASFTDSSPLPGAGFYRIVNP